MVHEITDESEFNSTLSANSIVAVQMFASWCGPCKAAAPKFDEISEQHPEATFVKVDVDELAEVAETWSVNCMPTFIVFKDGQVAQKIEGADFDRLRAAVTMYITQDVTATAGGGSSHNNNNGHHLGGGSSSNTRRDAGEFGDDEDGDDDDDTDDDEFQGEQNKNNNKTKNNISKTGKTTTATKNVDEDNSSNDDDDVDGDYSDHDQDRENRGVPSSQQE